MADQPELFTIKRDIEWEAINSAVRFEMVLMMILLGPCSIREVAELLDRPADGLYHHMRKLVAAGLVVEVERRKVGKQTEVIYQTAARDVSIDRNLKPKRTRDRTIRLFRTILQHAQRTIEAAIQAEEAVLEGDQKNTTFNWLASWLDEEQLAKVREHHEAIHQILYDGLQRRQGRLVAVLTFITPIVRSRTAEKRDE